MNVKRNAAVEMSALEFKIAGHELVDKIAAFIEGIGQRKVTPHEPAAALSTLIGDQALPEKGGDPNLILQRAADLLFDYSLLNGHPKFFGYITSSAAPIGALADLLAASVNPNVGAHILSPVATEIEKQVIKWLASFIGVPGFDGVLVSGGNMANFTAFFAAINNKVPSNKKEGLAQSQGRLRVYCSKTTHTWIEKAAVLSGLGSNAVSWIGVNEKNQMDIGLLQEAIENDKKSGLLPIMVIGTAGDVSTGAVDDLKSLAYVCQTNDCWFHVDGAYGIPAAVVPALHKLFEGIEAADSIALDPHKWLYAPLEAGCTLVKDPNHLIQTYSAHPVYYNFSHEAEPAARNFYEYGFQNSRGFRALKVWMVLQQAGTIGYIEMIETDIRLSKLLFQLADKHPELEAVSQHLSITTLRYRPTECPAEELDKLNEDLLNELQRGGEVFLSNAVVQDTYCLRACIVNFRTNENDIRETIEIIVRTGRNILSKFSSTTTEYFVK